MIETIDRLIERLAFVMAMLGGLVLIAVMLIVVVSITGRGLIFLGLGPVPGDFELVEAGSAFAIFAFLGWCQYNRGHVTVDLFLGRAGPKVNAWIDLVSAVLMTVAATVIAWRLFAGLGDKMRYGETTFILQFPLWWSYAAALTGAATFALVSAWTILRGIREVRAAGGPKAATAE